MASKAYPGIIVKRASKAQSATSLGISPQDDAHVRVRNYLVTMGIRMLCFLLVIFVRPYGWYTFVFAAGAIFLPYIAVVMANVASSKVVGQAVHPEQDAVEAPPADAEQPPTVIRVDETPRHDRDDPHDVYRSRGEAA